MVVVCVLDPEGFWDYSLAWGWVAKAGGGSCVHRVSGTDSVFGLLAPCRLLHVLGCVHSAGYLQCLYLLLCTMG